MITKSSEIVRMTVKRPPQALKSSPKSSQHTTSDQNNVATKHNQKSNLTSQLCRPVGIFGHFQMSTFLMLFLRHFQMPLLNTVQQLHSLLLSVYWTKRYRCLDEKIFGCRVNLKPKNLRFGFVQFGSRVEYPTTCRKPKNG